MSIERDVLSVLSQRERYLKFSTRVLSRGAALTKETTQIIKDLREYYSTYEHNTVDWREFSQWFLLVQHSMYKDEQVELYQMIFTAMTTHEPSALETDIIRSLVEQSVAEEIAVISGKIAEGNDRHGLEEVTELMTSWQESQLEEEEENEDDWTLEDLMQSAYSGGGYNWRMRELNDHCGPLRDSNLVLFGARPGMGKTCLMMSEVSYMASQIEGDRCVLAIHNEEGPAKDLRLRWLQSTIGWTPVQIDANMQGAMEEYVRCLGTKDRIIVRHMPGASVQEIESLLVKLNPAIIVVDQLRLCGGFGKNNTEVERLKDLYRWARIQASTYGPFLTVHQAGDAAENRLFPSGNMLEGCKTEIQGALDLQVMIGNDDGSVRRGMNIVKNKLAGTLESDPSIREGNFEVRINPLISRYEGNQ
jgi:hypothetical protein